MSTTSTARTGRSERHSLCRSGAGPAAGVAREAHGRGRGAVGGEGRLTYRLTQP